MLSDVLPYLRCPVCGGALTAVPAPARPVGSLRCPRHHSFDVARHGYVPLVTGRRLPVGDSAEMVAARQAWLTTGGFDFLTEALVEAVDTASGLVIDVGAGTGHHLAAVLDTQPGTVGLAIDTSKAALRRAARAHPRIGAVLADVWRRLPVADAGAAVVLNVFAPRNGAEFRRVLRPDGQLVVATPTVDHLAELVSRLALVRVDPEKPERIAATLHPWFHAETERILTWTLLLTRHTARLLIGMGPSAHHVEVANLVDGLPEPFPVTASVRVTRYRPTG